MTVLSSQWFAAPTPILTLDDAIDEASATTNLKLVLDAGDSASYGGSGTTWADVSGNSTDFDFGDGAGDTDTYPTFTGTSGDLTNYMSFDNDPAEWFRVDSASPAAPAWANTLHKDGAIFTCCMWCYVPSGAPSGEGHFPMWSTGSGGWVLGFLNRLSGMKQAMLVGHSTGSGPLVIDKTSDSEMS